MEPSRIKIFLEGTGVQRLPVGVDDKMIAEKLDSVKHSFSFSWVWRELPHLTNTAENGVRAGLLKGRGGGPEILLSLYACIVPLM